MNRSPALWASFSLIILASAAAAQERQPFRVEESGRAYWRLDDAVKSIGNGDGTIMIKSGTYGDCAVQNGGNIVFRAEVAGQAIFDGGTCDGKAALVLHGLSARVEGLVFQNMRVNDRNGAGIRLESGDLTVTNSMFRNSEQGILTANDASGQISIDRSTFSGLGGCPGGSCSHSIYIGDYGKLTVTRSRFERGTGGHYVKSRAAEAEISNNSFDDSNGRETNYMIDLSAGAVGSINGNMFVQRR